MSNTTEANNVIQFPRKFTPNDESGVPVITEEQIKKNVDSMKWLHIEETIAVLIPTIFNYIDISGFEIDEEEQIKDGAFLVESLRSVLCKYYGLYHPFQRLSENVFEADENHNGMLKVRDHVDISLKENEG